MTYREKKREQVFAVDKEGSEMSVGKKNERGG